MPFFSASANVLTWPYMEYWWTQSQSLPFWDGRDKSRWGNFNWSGELTKTIAILGAIMKCLCGQICGKSIENTMGELQ